MLDPRIAGFGRTRYRYAGGHEGGWFCIGLAPRGQNLALCLACGLEQHTDLLAKPGRHRTGRSCLYVSRLQDIDLATLRELIGRSAQPVAAEPALGELR